MSSVQKMVSSCDEDSPLDQSDCCGNGCANCVLDAKPKQNERKATKGKKNVISNYTKFKLISKYPHSNENCNVLELHFVYAGKSSTADCLDIPAGAHIMMRALLDVAETGGTKFWLRPYSPYFVDVTKMEFKILVNLKPQGPMSRFITTLKPDDEVEFRGPIGTYDADQALGAEPKCIFIFTQGVAIAPTLPIIAEVLNDEDNMSRIFHLACFTDFDSVYFRKQLQDFNKYWNFKGRIYLSRQHQCGNAACVPRCSDQCEDFLQRLHYKEVVYSRRLSATEIYEICSSVNGAMDKGIFIVCGTRDFQNFIVEAIRKFDLNVKEENVFVL